MPARQYAYQYETSPRKLKPEYNKPRRINLRITPEIIFILDDSMEYGERIDKILKEILPPKPENN